MKTALVYFPPLDERVGVKYPSFPPLGLGYIAAYLKENGQQVELFDLTVETSNWLIKTLVNNTIELVGFSTFTWNKSEVLQTAKKLKESLPEIKIVVGGPEPSYNPDLFLKYDYIDGICRGEGEKTFLQLAQLKHFTPEIKIPGLQTKKNPSEIVITEDLSELPSPYLKKVFNLQKYHIFGFQTHRGCLGKCSFCQWEYPGKIRYYPINHVIEELEYLSKVDKLLILQCLDADFLHDKQYSVRLLRGLIKRRIRFPQVNFEVNYVNLNEVNAKLMSKIAETTLLAFGLESASLQVQKEINKKIDLNKFKEKIKEAKKHNLITQINMLIGLPAQNWRTIETTLNYLKEVEPHRIVVNTVNGKKMNPKNESDFANLTKLELLE
ncbi:MAG: B12-binding domain-containing radical SAM protein, partial [Candidatus Odinarchaeia archaeon]